MTNLKKNKNFQNSKNKFDKNILGKQIYLTIKNLMIKN